MTAATDFGMKPLRIAANAKTVANSAMSFIKPPPTFPRRKIIEHPITHVYTPARGPEKSKLIIMGTPVRSHETMPGRRGKGMSNGSPFCNSDAAANAPSMLASASFLVSSLSNYASPLEKKMLYVKSDLCFLQNKMSFLSTYVSVFRASF